MAVLQLFLAFTREEIYLVREKKCTRIHLDEKQWKKMYKDIRGRMEKIVIHASHTKLCNRSKHPLAGHSPNTSGGINNLGKMCRRAIIEIRCKASMRGLV